MDTRSRQDALAGWLRGQGFTTVGAAARRFEVSARTIHRDLARLRAHGVAVVTEPGRGGGLHLDPELSLPPVRLDLTEVMALVVAVSLAQQDTLLPLGKPARAALAKLVATLPKARSRELSRLLSRVVVGQGASPRVVATLTPVDARTLDAFEQAFFGNHRLRFRYCDQAGKTSTRRVEPHGLLLQTPAWYLLAFDIDKGAARTFRMDRITQAQVESTCFTPRSLQLFEATLKEVGAAERLSGRL
ncbi:MAG: WYL domain-containing protein [Myxococcales bacterium]|nr:WYL domain-containing protein [Myxococcales bacterium]